MTPATSSHPGSAGTQDLGRDSLEQLRHTLRADPRVVDVHIVDVPGNRAPWLRSGLELDAGARVSTFAVGRVYPAAGLDIWFGPAFQLWARVGAGPVFRGTRPTHTFTASHGGPLELASYFPGEWADPSGRLAVPAQAYEGASGQLSVLIVRWADDTDLPATLRTYRGEPTGLIDLELDRLEHPVVPPDGWRHLWYLGDSEIFRARGEPGRSSVIECHTRADTGILQHDVDLPLTETTTFAWSWRFDELPSTQPEDSLASHDYLSIALEFDNGQDLTWHWSSSLPVGHSYRCPIRTWTHKETHMVLRSGTSQLGQWLDEERRVLPDYTAAVGAAPARIVRVWLIALSLFQRRTGRCAFRDIRLSDRDTTVAIT